MGRRRNDNIFVMLIDMPWWASLIAAGLFYLVLGVIIPSTFKQDDMGKLMTSVFGMFGKMFAGLALLASLVTGVVAIVRSISGGGGDQQAGFSDGSGSSPQCPVCGRSMVKRTARRGINAGSGFWGCSRYPACKGIVNM